MAPEAPAVSPCNWHRTKPTVHTFKPKACPLSTHHPHMEVTQTQCDPYQNLQPVRPSTLRNSSSMGWDSVRGLCCKSASPASMPISTLTATKVSRHLATNTCKGTCQEGQLSRHSGCPFLPCTAKKQLVSFGSIRTGVTKALFAGLYSLPHRSNGTYRGNYRRSAAHNPRIAREQCCELVVIIPNPTLPKLPSPIILIISSSSKLSVHISTAAALPLPALCRPALFWLMPLPVPPLSEVGQGEWVSEWIGIAMRGTSNLATRAPPNWLISLMLPG